MIKTGPHLKQAREALGWSPSELARALRLAGGEAQGEKRVLEMESGRRALSGPVTVAVESFLHGYKPLGFKTDDVRTEVPEPRKRAAAPAPRASAAPARAGAPLRRA
jgi:hypothetical protein